MVTSFVPVTLTALVRRHDGRELKITAGDLPSKDRRQFIELAAADEGRFVRLEWPSGAFERLSRKGLGFVATVYMDDGSPLQVHARDRLFIYDENSASSELFAPKELKWLGEYLLDLKFDPAGIFAGPGTRQRLVTAYDIEGTAGCIGNFTGAGAGLGGAAGGVAGGLAGAGAGAVIGGAVGGSFGLGYCVVGPALAGAWDWLFGDD
jgi:hypothetical protein